MASSSGGTGFKSSCALAGATIWYVDDDNCPGPGTGSLADPFCRIQDAVSAAADRDTIVVFGGTYGENVVIDGKTVYLTRDLAGPRPVVAGGCGGSVFVLRNTDSMIRGFVITGGGGLAFGRGGDFTLDFCTIVANAAGASGGGIGAGDVINSLTITNSIVCFNQSPAGPSIYDPAGKCTVSYCDIQGGWSGAGANDFSLDPLFVDLTRGDFHLVQPPCQPSLSPCVDTGDPSVSPPPGTTASCSASPDPGDPDLGFHYGYRAVTTFGLHVMR